MKIKFHERRKKVVGITVFLGLFAAFLLWSSFQIFKESLLKPGLALLGLLLLAGGIWNGYLFAVMCGALAKMKKPIQSPQRNAGIRPSSKDSPASETPSAPAPRG